MDGDPETCAFTPRSSELRWWQVHLAGLEESQDDKEKKESVVIESVAVTISPGTYQRFTIFVIGELRTLKQNEIVGKHYCPHLKRIFSFK